MTRLFGNDWNDNDELMQLFFNLNRLASETERDLEEFLEKIEFIIRQYFRYTDSPLQLYDFFLNVASTMAFISEEFDMGLFLSKIEDFIDKSIFLDKLDEVIGERKQEKQELDEELANLQLDILEAKSIKTLVLKKTFYNPTEQKLRAQLQEGKILKVVIRKLAIALEKLKKEKQDLIELINEP
ncbi:hypothetical protein ES705_08127 [subsurface metagenome]